MKKQKFILDFENEEEISVCLLRTSMAIDEHEYIYQINRKNHTSFSRVKDLQDKDAVNTFYHSVYEDFLPEAEIRFRIAANRSYKIESRKDQPSLFSGSPQTNLLLPEYQDVDFILFGEERFADYSVILLPENLFFLPENILLSAVKKIFKLIQFYE